MSNSRQAPSGHPRNPRAYLDELVRERDALKSDLNQKINRLETMRRLHAAECAELSGVEKLLSQCESGVDRARALRDALRPKYDRLLAEERRLRNLIKQLGL